jgi:hypothetical protein
VQEFYQVLGGQAAPGQPGFYNFPCANVPQLEVGFQLGGQNYMMDPEDFIVFQQGDECTGALAEFDLADDEGTEAVFLLGALFMKNIVSVFDLGTPAVGFGRLRNVSHPYGTATVVPPDEMTALGTGSLAKQSPTFRPPGQTGLAPYLSPDERIDLDYYRLSDNSGDRDGTSQSKYQSHPYTNWSTNLGGSDCRSDFRYTSNTRFRSSNCKLS